MVTAEIRGNVSGQVAVGSSILQIGEISGGVVTLAAPASPPARRPGPLAMPLRPLPGFLDREPEISAAEAEFRAGGLVQFFGPPGSGKTSLLRHLCQSPAASTFADGVAAFREDSEPLEDVLLDVYDALYMRPQQYRPTSVEMRGAFADLRGLLFLDDVGVPREEVDELAGVFRAGALVLTSTSRSLWGEGVAINVGPMPLSESRLLVEGEIGRQLSGAEVGEFEAAWRSCEGNPLRLLQVAAGARAGAGWVVAALALPDENQFSSQQRSVLGVLALAGSRGLPAADVAAVAGDSNTSSTLDYLEGRHFVERTAQGFRLAEGLLDDVRGRWDLSALSLRLGDHLVSRASAATLPELSGPVRSLLQWSAQAGQWRNVLSFSRAVEGAFALGGRWGGWGEVLGLAREAAVRLGSDEGLGWALHQAGTRLLLMGDPVAARSLLGQALKTRLSLGDQYGARLTTQNLQFADMAAATPISVQERPAHEGEAAGRREAPARGGPRLPGWIKGGLLLIGGLATGGVIGWGVSQASQETPAVPLGLTVPGDFSVTATERSGARVEYGVNASRGAIECAPASGALFPVGPTTVNCSVVDGAESDSASFTVTVEPPSVVEVVPLSLTTPGDFAVPATTAGGARVAYGVTATRGRVECAPASGALFPAGKTAVNCRAVDGSESDSAGFTVTVDGSNLRIGVPDDVVSGSAQVYFGAATSGNGRALCEPPSGSEFSPGPNQVECSSEGYPPTSFTVLVDGPDLAASDVRVSMGVCRIDFTVTNTGNEDAPATKALVVIPSPLFDEGAIVVGVLVNEIKAGSSRASFAEVPPSACGSGRYTVWLDWQNILPELDETNNQASDLFQRPPSVSLTPIATATP